MEIDGQIEIFQKPKAPKVAKKSRDYKECEKLGLCGAVRKNKNGKWEEAPAPQNNRQQGVFVATE